MEIDSGIKAGEIARKGRVWALNGLYVCVVGVEIPLEMGGAGVISRPFVGNWSCQDMVRRYFAPPR